MSDGAFLLEFVGYKIVQGLAQLDEVTIMVAYNGNKRIAVVCSRPCLGITGCRLQAVVNTDTGVP